jgi:hypothetical protein
MESSTTMSGFGTWDMVVCNIFCGWGLSFIFFHGTCTCRFQMSQPHFGLSLRMKLTLPKVGTWSPLGLPKTQSSIVRVKTPRIEVFFISMERSWSVYVQNGLVWAIGHLQPKLWAKEGPGVKLAVWLPTTKSRKSTSSRHLQKECDRALESSQRELQLWFKPLEESYNFGSDLIPIGGRNQEIWVPKVPGV